MNTAKESKEQLQQRLAQVKRERLITERDLFEIRIKLLKQQVEHRRMYNDYHYRYKKCKKTIRTVTVMQPASP